MRTVDGVRIAGSWFEADTRKGARPALVLLHGGNRYKERWQETGFVEALWAENYHVLAIDIRGRGESEAGDVEELRRDPRLALHDVAAALEWLAARPEVDRERIALVGSSYGANLACAGCLRGDYRCAAVVCFSATAALYRWLHEVPSLAKLSSGLFLSCDGEPARYAAPETAQRLAADTVGRSDVEVYAGPYHALSMFERVPECRNLVRDWLRGRLGP